MRITVSVLAMLFFIAVPVNADTRPQGESPVTAAEGSPPAANGTEADGMFRAIWSMMTDEAHLRIGYGVLEWAMDVKRSSDGATARLVQRDESTLFLGYGTKPSFIKDTGFGYTFMVNYVDFDMTKQEVPGDQFADYGTEVKGYLVYAVPTLFYQWGEHLVKGRFVRLGLGAGVGAARYHGTVRLSNGEVVYTEKRSLEPRLALSNFLEARWNHIGIMISYAAPRIYGDGYDIRVSDYSANIGYVYYF